MIAATMQQSIARKTGTYESSVDISVGRSRPQYRKIPSKKRYVLSMYLVSVERSREPRNQTGSGKEKT